MSCIPLLILCGPSHFSGLHNEECDCDESQVKGGGQIADILSVPFSPPPLLVTGDEAGGTLINQTSPAAASFRLISLVQLLGDIAIKLRDRERQRKR